MPSRGKRLTLIVASIAVLVLGVATWQGWPHIQFWWRFESLGPNAQGLSEYRHRQTGIVFVRLPGGTFWMGAQKDDPEGHNYDPNAESDEGPVHEVTLSPFLLGKFEVTQAEWHAVMGDYPAYFDGTKSYGGDSALPPSNRDRLPVETVPWDDIQEFEKKTGLRLPTEAQWEYGCRAGAEAPYAGRGKLGEMGWYNENSGRGPSPVGRKAPNDFGLYDMHGNVWEFCEDLYGEDFYAKPEATEMDPVHTSGSRNRVIRGGAWHSEAKHSRSALRRMFFLRFRDFDHVGFRVVATSP